MMFSDIARALGWIFILVGVIGGGALALQDFALGVGAGISTIGAGVLLAVLSEIHDSLESLRRDANLREEARQKEAKPRQEILHARDSALPTR